MLSGILQYAGGILQYAFKEIYGVGVANPLRLMTETTQISHTSNRVLDQSANHVNDS